MITENGRQTILELSEVKVKPNPNKELNHYKTLEEYKESVKSTVKFWLSIKKNPDETLEERQKNIFRELRIK